MSFENRKEDISFALNMNIGDSFEFNVFQDGGAEIKRVSDSNGAAYELYELKMYCGTPMFDRDFTESDIEDVIDEVYDKWT
ncbi:hypothetical protein NVP1198B_21 [Vibrio phage 1.198.B._10N.286.54.F4]|nr:hypothetical protein NVP1198A_21 [Vibrio phage 1.198.A._10N.286.54.F4]AUR94809.1 hypothetical protein NVP1198B_21 [Vibrio phage 1.198.B._10N.286.54.F4]